MVKDYRKDSQRQGRQGNIETARSSIEQNATTAWSNRVSLASLALSG